MYVLGIDKESLGLWVRKGWNMERRLRRGWRRRCTESVEGGNERWKGGCGEGGGACEECGWVGDESWRLHCGKGGEGAYEGADVRWRGGCDEGGWAAKATCRSSSSSGVLFLNDPNTWNKLI